jgi:hypothetical protein
MVSPTHGYRFILDDSILSSMERGNENGESLFTQRLCGFVSRTNLGSRVTHQVENGFVSCRFCFGNCFPDMLFGLSALFLLIFQNHEKYLLNP